MKHLFLQGNTKIGKSTLIQAALRTYEDALAGYVTQRILSDGVTIGFQITCIEKHLPPLEVDVGLRSKESTFIYHGTHHVSPLENAIKRTLLDSRRLGCKLVVLDEVGGIELLSEQFWADLERLLAGDQLCLGVFKSHINFGRVKRRMALPSEYIEAHYRLEELIRHAGSLLEMTEDNHNQIKSVLDDFVTCAMNSEPVL